MAYGFGLRSYKKWVPFVIIVAIIGVGALSISDFDSHSFTNSAATASKSPATLAFKSAQPSAQPTQTTPTLSTSSTPSPAMPTVSVTPPAQSPTESIPPAAATPLPIALVYSELKCMGAFNATLKNAESLSGTTIKWYWEYSSANSTTKSDTYTTTLGKKNGELTLSIATGQVSSLLKQVSSLLGAEAPAKRARLIIISPLSVTGPWINISSSLKSC